MAKNFQNWWPPRINIWHPHNFILWLLIFIFLSACASSSRRLFQPLTPPLGFDYQAAQGKLTPAEIKDLTLRRALALALVNNPELQAFSYVIRAQEARALQAGLIANPEISVEMENIYGQGAFRNFEAAETTIQLSQLVELGRKPAKRKEVALIEGDLKNWEYETKRVEVLSQVTKAFIEVLSAQEKLKITRELLNLTRQFRESVAARVEAGKVSPVELTRADISLAFAEVQMSQATKLLSAARQKLAATWGASTPNFHQVVGNLYSVKEPPPLKGVRYFRETNNRAYVFNLSFPLPLFNRQQGTIMIARYYLEKTQIEEKAIRLQFQTKLTETYRLLEAYHHQVITLSQSVLPAAQKAFAAIKEGYQQGKFSFLDVLDAQRTLVEARIQYLDSLGAYHQTVTEIERLINGPLTASQEIKKEKAP